MTVYSQWNTRDRETNGVRQAWSWNRVNAACVTMNYSRCCTRDYKKKESVLHAWRKTVRVVHVTTKQNSCRTRNREAVGATRVTRSSAQYYTSFTFSHVGAPRMMLYKRNFAIFHKHQHFDQIWPEWKVCVACQIRFGLQCTTTESKHLPLCVRLITTFPDYKHTISASW